MTKNEIPLWVKVVLGILFFPVAFVVLFIYAVHMLTKGLPDTQRGKGGNSNDHGGHGGW